MGIDVKKIVIALAFVLAAFLMLAILAGCNPEYIQHTGQAAIDRLEFQLTDPDSPLQQGAESGTILIQEAQRFLGLVPVPYAKELNAAAGLVGWMLSLILGKRVKRDEKALKEIILGGEAFKDEADEHGQELFKLQQAMAQSAETKVLVAQYKNAA